MKKIATFLSTLCLSTSSFAMHTLHIENHTSIYATAKTLFSPCSSIAGNAGILSPHGVMNIGQAIEDLYCSLGSCDVYIYASKNCSGNKIATVKLKHNQGIISIHNTHSHAVHVAGYGYNGSLEEGR